MLEDIKLKEFIEIISLLKGQNKESNETSLWEVGKGYFLRTVTMHLIGKLKVVTDRELFFENAIWVADAGRFHDALKTGELNEVEPFINNVIVNRYSIVDATVWDNEIKMEQK